MKILLLATKVPFPPKDGGTAMVYIFSKILNKLGHSVHILAVNPPKQFISKSMFSELPNGIQIDTIEMNTTPRWYNAAQNLIFNSLPYQVERFINKKYEDQLITILEKISPDIVQIEGVYLCPYIPVIRKYSSAKIILRAHNIEHALWFNIADQEKNPVKKLYLRILSKRLKKYEIDQFAIVDGITTTTEIDMQILKIYQQKTKASVVPFGIEPLDKLTGRVINTGSVSFIGALDWIPNQEAIQWFILEVWPRILKKYPALQFHIAGRNAPPSLRSFIQQQKGIVFHGEVADSKSFLNQFSMMVVPLFSGSGIRVKIIEAMQYGLVVIASAKALAGIPAVHGSEVLIADSPEEYVQGITSLMEDQPLITQLSTNAMDFVLKKYNISTIGSELNEFYREILTA
jgi:polysaccharide biosynthesis protein PslH